MRTQRFRLRLAVAALFALLVSPFAAPSSALAHEVSCDQNTCGCCIIICHCGESGAGCGDDATEETPAEDPADTSNDEDGGGADDTPTGDASALIRFSELLPNPVGSDTEGEFIELANVGSTDAQMSGWLIRNASGKEFALPVGAMASGGKLALPYSETKIALTNGGMTLELVGPDGMVWDSVTYPDEVAEGQAYAKSGDSWLWTTTPTPGFGNVITVEDEGGATDQEEEDTPAEPAAPVMVINELLANPVGDDATGEWVELYNPATTTAVLNGWSLDDAEGGSNPYGIPDGTEVAAGGYLLLERPTTKLALNNGGDSVRLFAADGTLADTVSYDGVAEGEALALTDSGEWATTTTPTPGEPNAFPEPEEETADDSADEEDEPSTDVGGDEQPTLTVEQVHDLPNETMVTVTGVVTMPLGVVGTTIFGIRDADAEYGATVRIYSSDRPDLQVGDIVVVDGKVTRKDSGELRINTSGSHPVTIIGSVDAVDAPEVRIEELDGTGAGLAVTVTGTVTDIGSDWFIITDSNAEREIKVELPTGSAMPVESGDLVTVSGIVRVERSVVALAVLDDGDVSADATDDTAAEDGDETLAVGEDDEDSGATLPFLVVGALGAGGVAYRGFSKKNGNKKAKLA